MVFDRLRKAFKKFVENVSQQVATRELKAKDVEPLLEELVMNLVENDVAYDVAAELADKLREKLIGLRVPRFSDPASVVREKVEEAVTEILAKGWRRLDLVAEAQARPRGEPLKMVFFGVNGVGKTTTIAKFAYMFRQRGVTPVIVASDTFRAGAQEQLRKHAERLGVPFIGGKYGADPAAVAYDAIEYARSRGYRAVLIDTAGRMHTDYDLMEELRKIVRVVKPDYKVLVIDALTGNDAVEQAKFFEEAVGIDFIVLTKVDADAKGGAALSVAYVTNKPILYVGVGQGYGDLEAFEPKRFARKILGGG